MSDAKRSCGTCEWWDPAEMRDITGNSTRMCRVKAPMFTEFGCRGGFPLTNATDWCGEWTKREGEEKKS